MNPFLTGLWEAVKKPLFAVLLAAAGYVGGYLTSKPAEAPQPVPVVAPVPADAK